MNFEIGNAIASMKVVGVVVGLADGRCAKIWVQIGNPKANVKDGILAVIPLPVIQVINIASQCDGSTIGLNTHVRAPEMRIQADPKNPSQRCAAKSIHDIY